jgi:MutS domain V
MNEPDPEEATRARLAELSAISRDLERRSSALSNGRGITFLLTLGALGARLAGPLSPAMWALAAAAGATFVGLVIAHMRLVTKMNGVERRARLVERALQRITGDLTALPPRGERFGAADQGYLGDLDVFGRTSLFQLVCAAETGLGERLLASWLSAPASAGEIEARQAAARELAALPALREELAVDAAEARTQGREHEPLVDWAEGRALGASRDPKPAPAIPALLARAGQVIAALTLVLLIARSSPFAAALGPLRDLWIGTLVVQVAILMALRPSIEPVLSVVASPEEPFGRYLSLLRRVEGSAFTSARLAALRASLAGTSGDGASRAIESLQRIVSFAELRHNGMAHLIVNAITLWDVFCALALDRWRARHGARVRGWLTTLAEIEALASLGGFAYEHPAFAFPEVTEGEPHFEAEGLAHPLLPAARRVANDVTLSGASTALMITGSNMSGKSTLLRSMGTAAVLALAGAPVCATRLSMSVMSVRTSMRIKDSLEQGVSHFYAELGRLKAVVDAVRAGDRVLFLLDEVLHGTNSRERQIGAKAVVLYLLRRGAVGAVSSHDLGLASLAEESHGRVRNVHFEELVADDKMTFDYTLKPGVVRTANALRLMKLIGIDVDLPELDEPPRSKGQSR